MLDLRMPKVFIASALICFTCGIIGGYCMEEESVLFWPPPPAQTRINFVKAVYSASDIGIKPGLFRKIKSVIFGGRKDILNKPVAVAVDRHKTIYICDIGAPAVHLFLQKEKRYSKITAINGEELLSPVSIAVSGQDMVFIADSKLRKVYCLDSAGKFKFAIGSDNKFLRPTGVAVSKEKLYVVDTLKNSVFIFDLSGKLISEFGARGKEDGLFNYPTAIASDSGGRIYICDTLNFRIQVFDQNNKFLYSIGQLGDSSGSFSRPKAVAVDSFGHIYVTDGVFDNVQIFNPKNEFLLSFGESGHNDGEFWIPCGIAIDAEDYIYVADSYNQRLQIFRYVGKE